MAAAAPSSGSQARAGDLAAKATKPSLLLQQLRLLLSTLLSTPMPLLQLLLLCSRPCRPRPALPGGCETAPPGNGSCRRTLLLLRLLLLRAASRRQLLLLSRCCRCYRCCVPWRGGIATGPFVVNCR